jgi:hypothetical protein
MRLHNGMTLPKLETDGALEPHNKTQTNSLQQCTTLEYNHLRTRFLPAKCKSRSICKKRCQTLKGDSAGGLCMTIFSHKVNGKRAESHGQEDCETAMSQTQNLATIPCVKLYNGALPKIEIQYVMRLTPRSCTNIEPGRTNPCTMQSTTQNKTVSMLPECQCSCLCHVGIARHL